MRDPKLEEPELLFLKESELWPATLDYVGRCLRLLENDPHDPLFEDPF